MPFLPCDRSGQAGKPTGRTLIAENTDLFRYVRDDKDVLQLITNLIQNTTPPPRAELRPVLGKIRNRGGRSVDRDQK